MKDIESVIELYRQLKASGVRNAYGGPAAPAMDIEADVFRAWFPDFASVTVITNSLWGPYRCYSAEKDGIAFSCLSAEPIYEEDQK